MRESSAPRYPQQSNQFGAARPRRSAVGAALTCPHPPTASMLLLTIVLVLLIALAVAGAIWLHLSR